jgi:hypothetical protein
MKSIFKICSATAIVAFLAGCNGGITISDGSGMQSIRIRDGGIAIHRTGAPEADITVAGDLSIDGKPVALSPNQRDLLKQYYTQVLLIRADGIATGKAGASMAGHAVGSVVSGLVHGDPDSIGPAIDAHAKTVEAKAMVICTDMVALEAKQVAIANALPVFKPYASIDTRKKTDCEKDQD